MRQAVGYLLVWRLQGRSAIDKQSTAVALKQLGSTHPNGGAAARVVRILGLFLRRRMAYNRYQHTAAWSVDVFSIFWGLAEADSFHFLVSVVGILVGSISAAMLPEAFCEEITMLQKLGSHDRKVPCHRGWGGFKHLAMQDDYTSTNVATVVGC